MPDDKTVAVRLTATNDMFKKAMLDAGGSVKNLAGTVEQQFKKISSTSTAELVKTQSAAGRLGTQMMSIGAGAAVLGAGLLTVGFKMADTFEKVGLEVAKVQRFTGLSAEAASVLRYQAQKSSIDVDALTKSLGMMAKGMANTPDKFTSMGVAVRDSNGKLRSTSDVLLDVADKVAGASSATDRLTIAQDAFGRNGAQLLPMLSKGRDGLAALGSEAARLGLVLGQDNVNAAKAAKAAHNEFNAAVQGLQVQIGSKFLPVITSVTEGISGVISGAHGAAGEFFLWGGATLLAAGGAAVLIGKVITISETLKVATVATKAFGLVQSVLGMSSLAAAGALGVTAAAAAAVAYAYKQASDSANDVLKPEIEVGRNNMLSESYDSLTDHIGRVKGVADDFGNDWNPITRNAEGDVRKLQQYGEHIKGLADAVATAAGISNEEALKWVQGQYALGTSFDTTSAAVAAYTGKVDTSTMSASDAAAAVKAQRDEIKALNDEMRAAVDPYFATYKAQQDVAKATWEASAATQKYGAGSAEATDAQMALITAGLDLAATQRSLNGEVNNGHNSMAGLTQTLEDLRAQGIDPSSEAAQTLIAKLYGVQLKAGEAYPSPNVDVTSNVDYVFLRLQSLAELLKRMKEELNTDSAGGGFAIHGGGRAVGGSVGSGQTVNSAEHGVELFRSSSGAMSLLTGPTFTAQDSGMVFTASQTRQMLRRGSFSGGGGVMVQFGDINVPNYVGSSADLSKAIAAGIEQATPRIREALRRSDRAGM